MSTTTTTSPTSSTGTGQPVAPWQGVVHASITRVRLDVVETVQFDHGVFTRSNRVVGGPSSQALLVLDDQARRDLLAELQAQVAWPPSGTDVEAIDVFVDLMEASLQAPPSHRFDSAHFGAITHDESTGTLFGHMGLGVDMAGTVHDHARELTFEQHVVVLPPGPFRSLSDADRASLAAALRARPPADPLWQQIPADAAR